MVGYLYVSQISDRDADAQIGIGAADITKLKLNGYYTVAVMTKPYLLLLSARGDNLL